jgi:hypothetical protein
MKESVNRQDIRIFKDNTIDYRDWLSYTKIQKYLLPKIVLELVLNSNFRELE